MSKETLQFNDACRSVGIVPGQGIFALSVDELRKVRDALLNGKVREVLEGILFGVEYGRSGMNTYTVDVLFPNDLCKGGIEVKAASLFDLPNAVRALHPTALDFEVLSVEKPERMQSLLTSFADVIERSADAEGPAFAVGKWAVIHDVTLSEYDGVLKTAAAAIRQHKYGWAWVESRNDLQVGDGILYDGEILTVTDLETSFVPSWNKRGVSVPAVRLVRGIGIHEVREVYLAHRYFNTRMPMYVKRP